MNGHVLDGEEGGPFDRCAHCGAPVQVDYLTRLVVTIVGRVATCYGR